MKKQYHQNLKILRKKIQSSSKIEVQEIDYVLKWLKRKNLKSKMKVKKVNVVELKDWYNDGKGNLFHKSKQFFEIRGVKITSAHKREVSSWDQPILTQKHGGVLAFISRQTKKFGTQFLIDAKIEPGDDSILKISPSFQATQSNMNKAHGGKRPKFYDIIMQLKGAELIYYTIHNEEGARFWKKSNWNVIVNLKNPQDKRIKGKNYKWASLKQIKKLALKIRYVNPFVKTILFML